jgi:hypothetical protein
MLAADSDLIGDKFLEGKGGFCRGFYVFWCFVVVKVW